MIFRRCHAYATEIQQETDFWAADVRDNRLKFLLDIIVDRYNTNSDEYKFLPVLRATVHLKDSYIEEHYFASIHVHTLYNGLIIELKKLKDKKAPYINYAQAMINWYAAEHLRYKEFTDIGHRGLINDCFKAGIITANDSNNLMKLLLSVETFIDTRTAQDYQAQLQPT